MIYGWDFSTAIIGLTEFLDDGTYVGSWHCDLRKVEGELEKAETFRVWLQGTDVNAHSVNNHFVENRLGNFSRGLSSMQTLMTLAQFNSVCSYIVWTHGVKAHIRLLKLYPVTWKSLMAREGLNIPKGTDPKGKKELTLAYVRAITHGKFPFQANRNGNPQPWCYDMADSYCIGRAGWKKLCTESGSLQP